MALILTVGKETAERQIAVLRHQGRNPPVVWLGGFKSDMRATKAEAVNAWAEKSDRSFIRFDYSGHGESSGDFEDGTISKWLEEALAVIEAYAPARPILVGSSMGGWIALLAARALIEKRPDIAPAGMVLIAPAVDFTEKLMWDRFPDDIKRAVMETGVYYRPTPYSPDPYPMTRGLIEDGRRHLLFGAPIRTGCPVVILQGMKDPDVPWGHALQLVEHIPGDSVSLTLVKDGDHRLSTNEDLDRLIAAIESVA